MNAVRLVKGGLIVAASSVPFLASEFGFTFPPDVIRREMLCARKLAANPVHFLAALVKAAFADSVSSLWVEKLLLRVCDLKGSGGTFDCVTRTTIDEV